ncbi:hypothetical protein OEB99_05185 [Actinotalea sp. M2MS4P-6]|uniref:hypothetical protein n=1 Tax=Actinotalea sp. M2MS4P-6 TaxID=2983762 RepID=UPI0021E4B11A|nr:hypothetical protein [Actinotalea sp. M2MS4P-6]MCV2393696.1 hypothetical protein [Actinotalea sp. M2MS4P-6]
MRWTALLGSRSFELVTRVPGTPEAAVDFLADLAAHRGLHAYLESAEVVGRGSSDEGQWVDWRVAERPRLGPFRYRIRFPARMIRTSPTTLVGRVVAAPGCTLETSTTATEAGSSDGGASAPSGVELREVCVVSAPWPLVGYMTRHARIAHERTYARIAGVLSGA